MSAKLPPYHVQNTYYMIKKTIHILQLMHTISSFLFYLIFLYHKKID